LIHGSAGTGKSVLIRAIKQAFAERYEALHAEAPRPATREVDPTAATGTGVTPLAVLARRTYEERLLYPLPEKKWKLRVTASTGLAAV
jgi:predicted ATPase